MSLIADAILTVKFSRLPQQMQYNNYKTEKVDLFFNLFIPVI